VFDEFTHECLAILVARKLPVSCPSGCSFVRQSSANSIVSDSPIRRRCTTTLFPAILGLHLTLNAFSAGLLVAVTSAGLAQELPRPPELPPPPEPLRTASALVAALVQVMRNYIRARMLIKLRKRSVQFIEQETGSRV
jgi:hypothetical protein